MDTARVDCSCRAARRGMALGTPTVEMVMCRAPARAGAGRVGWVVGGAGRTPPRLLHPDLCPTLLPIPAIANVACEPR